MQEASLPIITNEECKKMYQDAGHNVSISNNMICAGYKKGGKASCQVRSLHHFFLNLLGSEQRYTYRVLQTIQMKLILLWVWAELKLL